MNLIDKYSIHILTISFSFLSWSCLGQDSLTNDAVQDIYADPYAYKDTIVVKKYSYTDIFYHESLIDTSFTTADIWYNPTQSINYLYAGLGHIGSAHLKDYYLPHRKVGIRLSFPNYDLYKISPNTPEYRLNTAFTRLEFSQGNTQGKQHISAEFAGKYNKGKLSIGYKRIKDAGYYLSQLNIHTGIYAKLSYRFKPVLLQFQVSSNIIQAQDNGGYASDTLFPQPFTTFRSNIPINLNGTAETRHQEKYYIIRDYWPIVGSLNDTSFIVIRHKLQYVNKYVRFFDTDPVEDYYPTSFYDARGLRYYIRNNSIENSFHLLWRTQDLSWLQGQLNLGILHEYHFLEEFRTRYNKQWMAIDGKLQTDIGDIVRLETSLTQSVIPDVKDTRFINQLSIGWRQYFEIHGKLNFIKKRPAINERRFAINGLEIWDSPLKPETVLQLGGSLEATSINTEIGLEYNRISHLIYYTSERERLQAHKGINLVRMYLRTRLKLGILHLDSETSYQATQNNLLPYSPLVSDVRLYLKFYLFGSKMKIVTGPYGKYYLRPHGYTYAPALGQFIITNKNVKTVPYQLNYVLSFQVLSLNVYAHITGLQSFWSEYGFYAVQDYAYPVIGLRFGATWKLYN